MKIKQGNNKIGFCPGVEIHLSGSEVATAIDAYLVACGVTVRGPRTIRVNDEFCDNALIYVDPSGTVQRKGKTYKGKGEKNAKS